MSVNSRAFAADLAKFEEYAIKRCDAVLRESIIGLTQSVVELTPFITGRARSNYFWSNDSGNTETSTDADKTGAPSLSRAVSFGNSVKAGGTVQLTTALSYIGDLEYGKSDRAPHAMMRTTAARWKQIGHDAEMRATQ